MHVPKIINYALYCVEIVLLLTYQKIIEHYQDIQYTDMCKLFLLAFKIAPCVFKSVQQALRQV